MTNQRELGYSEYPKPSSIEEVLFLERTRPFRSTVESFEQAHSLPFERTPFTAKEDLLLRRMNEIVEIMQVNPEWKNRLHQAGVDEIRSWKDWQKVPITTRADLHDLYTVSKRGLVIPWGHPSDHNGHKSIASGGSTGEPILTIYRASELVDVGKRAGALWRRAIMQESDNPTILSLFNNANGWASNELVQNLLEGTGANTIPAGDISLPHVARFFLEQKPTDITGLPSNFAHLVKLLKEGSDTQYPDVKRAVYGGEFMDPLIKDMIKEVFPNIELVSIYSSTQADHMAAQIGAETDYLRITDDINFLEIVDEDGKPLPYGQVGRIIATRLLGNGDQPLRLDLQDKGSIELADPNDPIQARKLKLYGRAGDYLRVSTWDIKAGDLLETSHKTLQEMYQVTGIITRQLVVDENGVHLKLAVSDAANAKQLPAEIQFKILQKAIMKAKGFFEDPHDFPPSLQLTIRLVSFDELEKTPAGKIHPFINKRGKK